MQTLPALTVVSIGLRGSYTRKNYEEGLLKLNRWRAGQKEWQTNAAPYVVYWNSPFMPWFLRKSEIHIPVTRVANAVLIDRNGKLSARFGSRTAPDDPKLIEAIEKALEE